MPWARRLRCGRTIRPVRFASLRSGRRMRRRRADCWRSRRCSTGLAGRGSEDRRDGSPDAAGLGDPVQRARAGRSHQHSFTWRAAQARREHRAFLAPARGGGPDPSGARRGALAGVRSDHAGARGVRHLGVGRHDLSYLEGRTRTGWVLAMHYLGRGREALKSVDEALATLLEANEFLRAGRPEPEQRPDLLRARPLRRSLDLYGKALKLYAQAAHTTPSWPRWPKSASPKPRPTWP